ncbi:ANTAR domain-containing response regulator [Chitinimonas sp. BJYL2]|uniref:ANTAR domain-containing response regulator n=1 Tax=Chitinimonas sp. BJYL2 TaxID=2976696 RepID=UPI0022B41FBD|nr:ANTAR domain-containing protein [Chitinimonas sp. BJYL2]
MLRILLVNDTEKPIAELREALLQLGYEVMDSVATPQALLKAVETQCPNVVIIDTESPTRDTLEQLAVMNSEAPRPVVMFSQDGDQQLIRSAVRAGVTAYVVDGMSTARLAPVIEVALARFDEERALRTRLAEAEQKLDERKLIERAKGLIMKHKQLGEDDAYNLLRKTAMARGQRLSDVAKQFIAAAELLG